MIIKKFNDYILYNEMLNDFLNSFDKVMINESDKNDYNKMLNKIISDLKLNISLISTFGTGIGGLYPIIEKLLKNGSIEVTQQSIILLTITSLTIIYLEEKKFKNIDEENILIKDSKSMLEELKLMGIGNGIVKKTINVLKSIKNIFKIIYKHLSTSIYGIIDMFAYTSLLIPIMNGLSYIVGKYDLTFDTLLTNFLSLGIGISTIIAKNGVSEILKRLNIKSIYKKKILDDINTNQIQDLDIIKYDIDNPDDLIKEKK